jgi:hypothetical protein
LFFNINADGYILNELKCMTVIAEMTDWMLGMTVKSGMTGMTG